MMNQNQHTNYFQAVLAIKIAILQSRYNAAKSVYKEMLILYFKIGKFVSFNIRNKNWGKGAIESISNLLQQELPGLRGFSARNIRNMRIFYEEWQQELNSHLIRQLSTDELEKNELNKFLSIMHLTENQHNIIHKLSTDKLEINKKLLEIFFKVGFTHHTLILSKTKNISERFFYIQKSANEFLSIEKLKYHLKSDIYHQREKFISNFNQTISDQNFKKNALASFKDELLLDFINIEDPDKEIDKRVLENAIVKDIQKIIMALGSDFSFIGKQYRLNVDEDEFFVDLLFFNIKIQSLIANDLKKGKFKPENVGKMNFYLSALDDLIKQPHENPCIGIILCKEKSNKVVKYSFRNTTKPMEVSVYKVSKEIPEKYKNILPDADSLRELL